MTERSPFKYFKTSAEIIRLALVMHIRFPLSLRNVEDLLHERGIDICHETVRFWRHRFGPVFAARIRKRRVEGMRSSHWRWPLDEVFAKINGERHCLWRSVDHEDEVLESFVTKARDKKTALKFLRKALKRRGPAAGCFQKKYVGHAKCGSIVGLVGALQGLLPYRTFSCILSRKVRSETDGRARSL